MRSGEGSLWSALACALLAAAPGAPDEVALPERRPVAGSHGFQVVSSVRYEARPDLPHRLVVDHQFPARSRWRLESPAAGQRVVEYRAGARGFRLPPGRSASVEVEGAELRALVGRMELRRAALFWPDGLDWCPAEGSDGERLRARLTDELDPERCWGVLEARRLADGRPGELALLDRDGRERERLVLEAWFESGERVWPKRLVLHAGGQRVWREEVLEASDDAYFLDLSFLPPDRRPGAGGSGGSGAPRDARARALDLVPHAGRRHALPGPPEWTAALAAAAELGARAGAELGPERVDPALTLLLDAQGRPAFVEVRLRAGADPPEGWARVPERPGLLVALPRPEDAPATLRALLAELPPGARAGEPYLRGYPPAEGPPAGRRRWELVVPLLPE